MKKFKIFMKMFSLCLIACCLFVALGCDKNKGPENPFSNNGDNSSSNSDADSDGVDNPFSNPVAVVLENITTNTIYDI